jgi:hypothetical protein
MRCYDFLWPRVPACNAKVSSYLESLSRLVDQITFCVFSHTTEQASQPTVAIISKQVIPYRTHGGTCCLEVSTPKIQSLADSSMSNHITWRISTISTIPTLLKLQHRPHHGHLSHHNRWKTTLSTLIQAKLNIIKMEDLYDSQDCRAKQFYAT